jgi:2-polyprenyl-3-methyl-5-hydroxy-6-metoxy-1,4-benzoquinol methylase
MKRFTWQETRQYWKLHNSRRATLDLNRDPDALDNVLHTGAPLWLNEYYARHQIMVYRRLFSLLPPARPGAKALDVGCGAGRWCRFLAEHGYQTVGIDLQRELIDLNHQRYPEVQFFCTSVQEFAPKEAFDLISSVTVIQHNPFSEQEAIIRKLRAMTNPGGHALILENVRDQGHHVFANSVRKWESKFKQAGFDLIALRRYDYNFLTRLYTASARKLLSVARGLRSKDAPEHTPHPFGPNSAQKASSLRGQLRFFNFGIRRLTIGVDGILEPLLIHTNYSLPTVHCGFLFRAK